MQGATRTALEVSTGHLPEHTRDWLEDDTQSKPFGFGKTDYGWLIYTCQSPRPEVPKELRDLIVMAHGAGCTYLIFDQDGDTIEGFPVFDW